MTSSHHRRLLWRKKRQDTNNVENDETPLMVLEDEESTTSGLLESKFAEFDRILNFDQWSISDGASRDNDEYTNDSSDVEDRDESHLLDLQRELEAAELGTVSPPSLREHDDEEEREDSIPGNLRRALDYNSLASSSTVDSFDAEAAIEKMKLQSKAMEEANQDDTAETDEQSFRFAQFVAQMEHDFDGAILAMMETKAEVSNGNDSQVVEERQPEHEHGENHEPTELPPFYPMETIEEEQTGESQLEIHDDANSDGDTDYTPFCVPDSCPSDEESRAYSSSQSDDLDQERVLPYYDSPEVTYRMSPLSDYGYNPYQEKLEPSFEPCVDLDQFAAASVQAKENRELEEQRSREVSQYMAQHHMTLQTGADYGYSYNGEYDDNEGDGHEYWGQKSKYPITRASFICLFHILIQFFAFRALLGLLLDYHQSTTNLLELTGGSIPMCDADFACQTATPVTLSESGEHQVLATTTTIESMNEIQNEACEGSWFQSPALWYSLIGDGSRHAAIASPTSDNFDVSIMILEGQCNRPDFHYGPSDCCGQAGESSLVWDTVEGKEYFIAVFGAQPNSTGSFRMTMWNTQHTKEALKDHIEQRDVKSFHDLAAGGSVGISMTFLAAVALA